jgi:thiol-disulfide isomerase/thioredoxin
LVAHETQLLSAQNKPIFWYSDVQQASADAQAANRPMMLEFWASWCAPCRLIDEQVFSDPAVIQGVGRGFIPVKINADLKETLKTKYGITVLPTIVFTNSSGTELFRHSGFISVAGLSKLLQALPVNVTRMNAFDRYLTKDKDNLSALYGMASELQQDGLYRLSNEYWERAIKLDKSKEDAKEREHILTAIASNDLKLEEGEEALKLFKQCMVEFPLSLDRPAFLLGLGQAYDLSGNSARARETLTSLIKQYPATGVAEKARSILNNLR